MACLTWDHPMSLILSKIVKIVIPAMLNNLLIMIHQPKASSMSITETAYHAEMSTFFVQSLVLLSTEGSLRIISQKTTQLSTLGCPKNYNG